MPPIPGPRGFDARLAIGTLVRQVGAGLVLWWGRSCGPMANALVVAVVVAALLAITWRFGLVRRRNWKQAAIEGVLLIGGAACFANLLQIASGHPPWPPSEGSGG